MTLDTRQAFENISQIQVATENHQANQILQNDDVTEQEDIPPTMQPLNQLELGNQKRSCSEGEVLVTEGTGRIEMAQVTPERQHV